VTLSLPFALLCLSRLAFGALPEVGGGSDPAVRIEVPTAPVHEGEAIGFVVVEGVDGAIAVDACSPIEVEQESGGKWLSRAVTECERGMPASAIDGKLTIAVRAPGIGTYRAVLAWGTGCAPGYPLATATCQRLGTAVSAPVTVTAPPAK